MFDMSKIVENGVPVKNWTKYYKDKPVEFCEDILGVRLWSKQRDILNALVKYPRVAIKSGHGTGKTFLSSCAVIWYVCTHVPSKVITTAPIWEQVTSQLWSEINHLLSRPYAKLLAGERSKTRFQIREDWFALGASPNNPVNFQGYHSENIMVVFDEAPGCDRALFEVAQTLGTTDSSRMLLIGNPVESSGYFYDIFRGIGDFECMTISCYDTPKVTGENCPSPALVSPEWIKIKKAEYGKDSAWFQSRVLGEFPEEGDNQLLSLKDITIAQERETNPNTETMRCMGVDVARAGLDKTVITGIFGNRVVVLHEEGKTNEMDLAGRIVNLISKYGINQGVAVDNTGGFGSGVVDRLGELGVAVYPINFGTAALNPKRFYNARTEMWWRLREWIQQEAQLKDIPDRLAADLTSVQYSFTSKGQFKLESKDDIKKRTGRSPDHGDSLVCAYMAKKGLGAKDIMDVVRKKIHSYGFRSDRLARRGIRY